MVERFNVNSSGDIVPPSGVLYDVGFDGKGLAAAGVVLGVVLAAGANGEKNDPPEQPDTPQTENTDQ